MNIMKRLNQLFLGVLSVGFLMPVLATDLTCNIESGTYSGGSSFSVNNMKWNGGVAKVTHFQILPDNNKKVALQCSCKMNKKHPNAAGFTACIWTLKDETTHPHQFTSDSSPESINLSVTGSNVDLGFSGGSDN